MNKQLAIQSMLLAFILASDMQVIALHVAKKEGGKTENVMMWKDAYLRRLHIVEDLWSRLYPEIPFEESGLII